MKYYIDYQYLPKGSSRPLDDGEVVPIEVSDANGFAIIPNVGDFVNIDNSIYKLDMVSFYGRVRSRLFRYICGPENSTCCVCIVVEETDEDYGKLIKE